MILNRIICMITLIFVIPSRVSTDEHERRLYKTILDGYDPLERPVENNSWRVKVELQIILNQIIDVDEKNQIVQTNIWMKYVWRDYHMQWNPDDFGGVKDVRLPYGKIWKPDILLYNSVDANFDTTFQVNYVVYNTSEINWVPPGIVKSSCNIDIRWFPFDEQRCYFKFSSWTYDATKLGLFQYENGWDRTEYIENGEWKLINLTVFRQEFQYSCCPEPYINLYFNFTIRRRTLYYGFNMIIPSLIVSLMTLLGFALPVESGEKVTLEITILLSVCVFLGMVASMTPATSEALPLIGIFFSCNMILVALSVVCSVVVLNFHYRTPDTHTMSPMLRNIMLNWLPWLLMMKRPGHKFSRSSIVEAFQYPPRRTRVEFLDGENLINHHTNDHVDCNEKSPLPNGIRQNSIGRIQRLYSTDIESRMVTALNKAISNSQALDSGMMSLLLSVQQIYSEVKFMAKRMEREDEVQEAKNDWRFAAMVVDRLCLVLFSTLIVLSTCGIFFSAPHLVA